MRVFYDVESAAREIRRDLSKANITPSSRVQGDFVEGKTAEAMNYQYSLPVQELINYDADALATFGATQFEMWKENRVAMTSWLRAESESRLDASMVTTSFWIERQPTELWHPALSKLTEGNHFGYTYAERLYGWLPVVFHSLAQEGSRRAYWPVFQPMDALRSSAPTRVPCTLGYHWCIRNNKLDVTILQRSCDFEKFWLSDIWFGAVLTHHLEAWLDSKLNWDLERGLLTHSIISFHKFVEEEEIY